jgi:hypothetical protein
MLAVVILLGLIPVGLLAAYLISSEMEYSAMNERHQRNWPEWK